MEQIHVASPNLHAIGSRTRSLSHFSCLFVSAVGTLAILFWVILQLIRHVLGDGQENTFFAFLVLAGGIFGVLIEGLLFRRIPGWLAFAMNDSAAGFVDTAGLRYRLFFRWYAVPWRDISRIEYFAADNGRIHVYVFASHSPIRFGPSKQTGRITALPDFLKNQAQTSKGVFIEHKNSAFRGSSALDFLNANGDGNRELIAKALVALSLIVWLSCFSLFQYYRYTRPRLPEGSQGRIYEQNNLGFVIYLTANEKNLLHALEFSAPVFFLAGVLLDPRKRIWQRPKNS